MFLGVFAVVVYLCAFFTFTFLSVLMQGVGSLYLALASVAYLVFMGVSLSGVYLYFLHRTVVVPMRRLGEASRRVAQGDYTVRLAPRRSDGKKDEIDVLFDDFNAMAAELGSTEIMKKDFVSNVSHELKTPLAVIQSYASVLEAGGLTDSERADYTRKIGEASRRLSVLVTNILQLSRLENQQIPPRREAFLVSERLCGRALAFERIMDEKGIDLECDLDEGALAWGDPALLDTVWDNLVSNALKFTEPGGTVRLRVRRAEDGVLVTVADTGCGIPADDLTRIFDKFYQADSSHATQGNGLGLALVARIVALSGGSVSVESALGEGSAFTVRLDAAEVKDLDDAAPVPAAAPSPSVPSS